MKAGLARTRVIGLSALAVAGLAGAFWAGHAIAPAPAPGKPQAAGQERHAPPGQVKLDLQAQLDIRLRTAVATTREIARRIEVPAVIAADEQRLVRLRPLGRGHVLSVAVHPGDAVRRGQVLLTYDDVTLGDLHMRLATARAVLAQAQAQATTARLSLARGQALAGTVVARGEVDRRRALLGEAQANLQSQRAAIADLELRLRQYGVRYQDSAASVASLVAPLDGVVLQAAAAPGDLVEPGQALLTVVNLDRLWVVASLFQDQASMVQPGGEASVTVPGLPGQASGARVLPAHIESVAGAFDSRTGALQVRCDIDNPSHDLRIGMFVRAALPTTSSARAVVVPEAAVQRIDDHPVLFTRTGPETFQQHRVRLGVQTADFVEVQDGLHAGDEVVTTGSFVLKSERLQDELGSGD
ncbi:efflux RND transporter periplasmic adaptor subunit [Lichenicoccus roseus]|uniref:efflux RND transporter periplasmic adaptor subunit n=1 Tax=Lichenicoccus roseus TaxID=2683649 RepID=UPI0014863D46|nr:efflux RND transporter periplasmic adaptor subunit [Lichenicoccus roseus]